MEKNYNALMIKPKDNVATALEDIPTDAMVTITCLGNETAVKVLKQIEFGHKFAVTFIRKGENIKKYGEVIGKASQDIEQGAHVHTHNIEGIRGRGDQIDVNE